MSTMGNHCQWLSLGFTLYSFVPKRFILSGRVPSNNDVLSAFPPVWSVQQMSSQEDLTLSRRTDFTSYLVFPHPWEDGHDEEGR